MKAQDLRKGVLAEAVVCTAALAGSVILPPISFAVPMGILIAGGRVSKAVANCRASLRFSPAFFLWRARGEC